MSEKVTVYRVWHCAFPAHTDRTLGNLLTLSHLSVHDPRTPPTYSHLVLLFVLTMAADWIAWEKSCALGDIRCAGNMVGGFAD